MPCNKASIVRVSPWGIHRALGQMTPPSISQKIGVSATNANNNLAANPFCISMFGRSRTDPLHPISTPGLMSFWQQTLSAFQCSSKSNTDLARPHIPGRLRARERSTATRLAASRCWGRGQRQGGAPHRGSPAETDGSRRAHPPTSAKSVLRDRARNRRSSCSISLRPTRKRVQVKRMRAR